MNLEKIKYFIDLVECRNFTETAKKNYVSQTTISQQIASLEREFELQLINRKSAPIEPTSAGMLFYEEAKIIWQQYQTMRMKMGFYHDNQSQVLRIEYSALTDIKRLMELIPRYKEQVTGSEIILEKVLLKNVSELLLKEVYDVAIAFDSEFYHQPKIATVPVYHGDYCAAVGQNHPLYHEAEITLAELYRYPLVMMSQEAIGKSYELMREHAIKDGYQPQIVKTVADIETELLMIRVENLIGFFPDNYSQQELTEGIRLIPIKDSHHHFEIVVAYLKESRNEAVHHFVKTIKTAPIV